MNEDNEKRRDQTIKRKNIIIIIEAAVIVALLGGTGTFAGLFGSTKTKLTETESTKESLVTQIVEVNNEKEELTTRINELTATINTLTTEKESLETQLAAAEASDEDKSATIEELNQRIENLNTQITTLTSEKGSLETQIEELNDQIESLQTELNNSEAKANTFTVFYVKDDTLVYSESVSKCNNVINVPTATPVTENATWVWNNDGKNIQSDIVIFGKECFKLTFASMQTITGDAFNLSTTEAYVPCGATIGFTTSTITYNDEALVTSTSAGSYSPSYWTDSDSNAYNDGDTLSVTAPMTFTSSYFCVFEGAKVTLETGNKINVEDLKLGDSILTYDAFTGQMVSQEVEGILPNKVKTDNALEIFLDNGNKVTVIDCEDVFDTDELVYKQITPKTYKTMIGHNIMVNQNGEIGSAKIISINLKQVEGQCFTIYTHDSINYVANDIILRTETWFTNDVYTIGSDYKVDMNKYYIDVTMYGQLDYSMFADVLDYDLFVSWRFNDFAFLLGKGIANKEVIINSAIALQEEINLSKSIFNY